MTNATMTKEQVIAAIQECTEKLGHVPSATELREQQNVSKRMIKRNFGHYRAALEACGLERRGAGHKLSGKALFLDWAEVARKLVKAPSMSEFDLHGKYSVGPLARRYGSWTDVPAGMMEYERRRAG